MTKLKICGLMNKGDVQLCARAGANLLGFVTNYPVPVPWNLTKEQAKELLTCVPKNVKSCLVTGGNVAEILSLAIELRPDYLQLHYKESLAETRYLAEALLSHGIKTIKAVPIREDGSCEMPEFPSVTGALTALARTKIAAIVIDSRCAASPASCSRQLTTDFCRDMIRISKKPLLLSGGITGDNLEQTLKAVAPYGVDILTGTEDAPGQKNKEKIEKLCQILAENKAKPRML